MSEPYRFTPTETRIMNVLIDGEGHTLQELHKCLFDELSSVAGVKVQIHRIRKYIRTIGQDIVTRKIEGTVFYKLVRLGPITPG